jgi:hypothetical protein
LVEQFGSFHLHILVHSNRPYCPGSHCSSSMTMTISEDESNKTLKFVNLVDFHHQLKTWWCRVGNLASTRLTIISMSCFSKDSDVKWHSFDEWNIFLKEIKKCLCISWLQCSSYFLMTLIKMSLQWAYVLTGLLHYKTCIPQSQKVRTETVQRLAHSWLIKFNLHTCQKKKCRW